MELVRGIHNLKAHHAGCVMTIGNFDGVHLGHQVVVKRTIEHARKMNLPATVMIFEPQPLELFKGAAAPARLNRLRDKYQHLKSLGVDRLVCVNFDREFASMAPEAFITELLINKLDVKLLIVGDDFRFGKARRGDFELLKSLGNSHFVVMNTDSFKVGRERISSTNIRSALADGDMTSASEMLGKHYSIGGKVIHGDKLGRTIGVPTSNIAIRRTVSPVSGVFIASVTFRERQVYGVCNIGIRPTVDGVRQQLEVHLFDFEQVIYGEYLDVVLRHKLREEQKFDSFEALKQQIQQDILLAKQWLTENELTA